MANEKSLTVPDKQLDVAKKLNERIGLVIGNETLQGFEKAFHIANAISDLKSILTGDYMKPIMALQNNKLGFKTDKDPAGYSEEVVKNCLIEAVLTGFEPWGNQFNIIAGSMYGTKEGFGAVLNKTKGLKWDITPGLPRINAAKDGAAVLMKLTWTYGNEPEQTKEIDFAVRMNQYAGVDAAIGKATRKARAWLFNKINGTEVGEGDVMDIDHKVMGSKPTVNKEDERIAILIKESVNITDLKKLDKDVPDSLRDLFNEKIIELTEKK